MTPDSNDIKVRMTNFLQRQRALLEQMRADLPKMRDELERTAETGAAEFQKHRDQALATMAKEFELLKREWNETEHLSPDQKAEIEALANDVKKLAGEVEPMVQSALGAAREKLQQLTSSLGDLRRGKQVMRAYKTKDSSQGGGLDQQG